MTYTLKEGTLVRWNDDRGFGFIRPDEGGLDVFLHIRTLKETGRRPQIGDRILYDYVIQSDGRLRAVRAFFNEAQTQAVSTRWSPKTAKSSTPESDRDRSVSHPDQDLLAHLTSVQKNPRPQQSNPVPRYQPASLSDQPSSANQSAQHQSRFRPPHAPSDRRPPHPSQGDRLALFVSRLLTKRFSKVPAFLLPTLLFLVVLELRPSRYPSPATFLFRPGCVIKGNISHGSGNYIYHKPGMQDYNATVIDPLRGEKWFCTESAAIAAGWKKATR